jgi:hypothetical protein
MKKLEMSIQVTSIDIGDIHAADETPEMQEKLRKGDDYNAYTYACFMERLRKGLVEKPQPKPEPKRPLTANERQKRCRQKKKIQKKVLSESQRNLINYKRRCARAQKKGRLQLTKKKCSQLVRRTRACFTAPSSRQPVRSLTLVW